VSGRVRSVTEALALAVLAAGAGYAGTYAAKHYVLLETIWKLGDAPPTAAALGLGFGAFWALTSFPGALFGRMVALGRRAAGSLGARKTPSGASSRASTK